MNFCPHCGSKLFPDVTVSDEVKKIVFAAVDSPETITLETLVSKTQCEKNTVCLLLSALKRNSEWRVSRCKEILGEDILTINEEKDKNTDEKITFGQKKIIFAISKHIDAKFEGKTKKEASAFIDKYKYVLPPRE